MIESIIRWSVGNRFLVLLATTILVGAGLYSLRHTPVDAIPDLSDVQVIIKTTYPGQAPQVVEDQVTYPLTTAMLSVPGAVTVRGYSFFGDSYVYIIFDEQNRFVLGQKPGAGIPEPGCASHCHKTPVHSWDLTPRAWVGYTSMHWSTERASMISANCARFRTGS